MWPKRQNGKYNSIDQTIEQTFCEQTLWSYEDTYLQSYLLNTLERLTLIISVNYSYIHKNVILEKNIFNFSKTFKSKSLTTRAYVYNNAWW